MKKRILTTLTVALMAAVAVSAAACTTPAPETFTSYTGVAYGVVHKAYVGKAEVTVLNNEKVSGIVFGEYLTPMHNAYTDITYTAQANAKITADLAANATDAEKEEARLTAIQILFDEAKDYVKYPANFKIFASKGSRDFTDGKPDVDGVGGTKAKLLIKAYPEYIQVADKFFKIKDDGTDYEQVGVTGGIAALDAALVGKTGTAYTNNQALMQWYVNACDDNNIRACKVETTATPGAFYVAENIYLVPMANSAVSVTQETTSSGNGPTGAASGLAIHYVTYNKADATNTYWRGANYAYGYEGNLNAMIDFFTKNGLDYAASDFEAKAITGKTGNIWQTKDGGTPIASNDGTAYATLVDLAEYLDVMKAANVKAVAKIPA